jgi:hypothetical protein
MLGLLACAATGKEYSSKEYPSLRLRLNRLVKRADIAIPFSWNTLDEWSEFFKVTFAGNYAARRAYVAR